MGSLQFGQSSEGSGEFDLSKEAEIVVRNAIEIDCRVLSQPLSRAVENAAEAAGGRPEFARGPIRIIRGHVLSVLFDSVFDSGEKISVL